MTRRSKLPGKLLIAVFLAWQVAAIVHLVAAAHAWCVEHGAVAHTDCETGDLEHHHETPFSSDDACFVLTALAANGAMPTIAAPEVLPAACHTIDALESIVVSVVLEQRYRFELSPSQSPPSPAV